MKYLIKIEELAFFGFSIVLFFEMDFAWWWFPVLLLAPDLSMMGYLINSYIGAVIYNLFHHRAVAILAIAVGYFALMSEVQLAGVMLLAHSSLDRVFGFGLKYRDSFHHTHLNEMRKPSS
ncbi:MAG: DUF4260 domain-containing protein [Spirochaetota bacterium]|nr:DUF4260 domain-containing protein [Spirochaetota bacterium]